MVETRVSSRRFLPHDPRVEEPWRFTPKIALRVAILGVVALAVFGVLFAVSLPLLPFFAIAAIIWALTRHSRAATVYPN